MPTPKPIMMSRGHIAGPPASPAPRRRAPSPASRRRAWAVALAWLLLLLWSPARGAGVAMAQSPDVTLEIPDAQVGLGGVVRRGVCAPVLINIDYRGSQPRKVRCAVEVTDFDGESASWERPVTLTPARKQQVWLYAVPRIAAKDAREIWRFSVIDAASGRLLASRAIEPFAGGETSDRMASNDERIVGVVGALLRGLDIYTLAATQHERARVIGKLDLKSIPDRWYGLNLIQTLIWSPSGGDPGAPEFATESAEALRQWVRRGGHLVISLPSFADPWPASPLRDLLPPVTITPLRDLPTPIWLGSPQEQLRIDAKALTPTGRATVLFSTDQRPGEPADLPAPGAWAGPALAGRQVLPLVVTHQVGMGRVTLIGIDLTDRRVARMNLPNGEQFWNRVLGSRAPAVRRQYVEDEQSAGRIAQASDRRVGLIDDALIAPLVSMGDAAGVPLAIAVVFFGVYWLAAGPIGFGLARARGEARHAWVLFVAVVAVFSLIAWGGAALLRQRDAGIAHLTVLDIDGGSGLVRAQSWLSLFVPRHGRVEVVVDPSKSEETPSLIAAPGLPGLEDASFINPERYDVPAAAPGRVRFPYRATAKQIEINFLGYLLDEERFLSEKWGLPRGRVRLENDWPAGKLTHQLPGTLRDVIAVYVRASGEPSVWRIGAWPAGKELEIRRPDAAEPLCVPAQDLSDPADPKKEKRIYRPPGGFLGELLKAKPGQEATASLGVRAPDDRIMQFIHLLTFYGNLPPPRYTFNDRTEMFKEEPYAARRSTARGLDLTPLLAMPRLILIGHLDKGPFPVPMSVDGRTVAAEGWTTVRWMAPLD